MRLERETIRKLRGTKESADPNRPYGYWVEEEFAEAGRLASVTTILLTGAECKFTCSMCDLWKHTLQGNTPIGALPRQLEFVQSELENTDWIKLYNGSNFFDPNSVPISDYPDMVALTNCYERVIVENHPRLLRDSIVEIRSMLRGRLEVAMGLETIHLPSLEMLNKEFTLEDFRNACRWLNSHDVDLRAFVLLQPPGLKEQESIRWAKLSVEFAIEQGVRHVSIIPTRGGNGAMELYSQAGLFRPPTAQQLETVLDQVLLDSPKAIVTVDLWDWGKLEGHCELCSEVRRGRLQKMNWEQVYAPEAKLECRCVSPKGIA